MYVVSCTINLAFVSAFLIKKLGAERVKGGTDLSNLTNEQ